MSSESFFARRFWRRWRLEGIFTLYRRLVLWSFSVASARYAVAWIMFFSYLEAIVFPLPPDAFLVARGVVQRKGLLRLALVLAVCSMLGGATSYAIGAWLFESLGATLLGVLNLEQVFARVVQNFSGDIAFWTIILFGFTILPFKVIALASGAAAVSLPLFLVAAFFARAARFLVVALLMKLFGARLKEWLQSRQSFLLSLLVTVLGLLLLVLHASHVF